MAATAKGAIARPIGPPATVRNALRDGHGTSNFRGLCAALTELPRLRCPDVRHVTSSAFKDINVGQVAKSRYPSTAEVCSVGAGSGRRRRSRSSTNSNLYRRTIGCKGPCDTEYRRQPPSHFLDVLRELALGLERVATKVRPDTNSLGDDRKHSTFCSY